MSDGPVTILPSTSTNFGDKTPEELEAILDALTSGDGTLPDPTPEPAPETPVPEESAGEPVEPEVTPEPEVEPEPEIDLASLEREKDVIEREKMQAELAMQKAHASRLAGEIGFLRQKLESAPRVSEPYEPQTQAELDRLGLLEQRLEQSETRHNRAIVSQAVESAIGSLDGTWVQEFAEEIAVVAPKYAEQINEAKNATDPELARLLATGVALNVRAEVREMGWQKRHDALVAQKQAATADMAKAKRAQTPSGSGGVPPPQVKPKSISDMTASEADAWLRENVR